jgi:hypothetical protein
MVNNLLGITQPNGNSINIAGKNFNYNYYNYGNRHIVINSKVKKVKDKIIQNYLIPLFSKQWNVLKENIFFIDELQIKVNYFYELYSLDELLVYLELLKVLKILVENYTLLENSNGTVHGKRDNNEIMSMMFKTSMIRLLPEYEIYDSIIGKPKKDLNEVYDENIITHIKNMLSEEDITYNKIKENIISLTTLSS